MGTLTQELADQLKCDRRQSANGSRRELGKGFGERSDCQHQLIRNVHPTGR